jgi:mRNA-degrading endonuclease YafQ of YafQ-DinJ toxin-antitoxin module
MRDQKIRDIVCDTQFFRDYDRVPKFIKENIDRKMDQILKDRSIPNSFQAHKVDDLEETLWIGYITYGIGGWRVLFEFAANGIVVFKRLLSHDQMETVLKEL